MENILKILKSIRPECDFSKSKDFIKEQLLDSFDIITLVNSLEEKYNFSVDGEDVTPENFKNLETLDRFIRRYLNTNES